MTTDKPTIEELEAILDEPDTKTEILPDGEVVVHVLEDILEIGRLEAELQRMREDIKLARLYLAQIPTVGSAVAADKALQAALEEQQEESDD